VADLVALDGERIAYALSREGHISRNGDGWKTDCPLCKSKSRRRKPRGTLSLTIRDGKILVHCHRCQADPVAIIRELVHLNLLPNNFRESSKTLALIDQVRAAGQAFTWKGTAALTDLVVLQILLQIARRCLKTDFSAAVREIGLCARRHEATVWRSLHRLVKGGWLERVTPARGTHAAIWRLRIPFHRADRDATIPHAERAGDCVLQSDPCLIRGDRAGSSRSVLPFDHDLFRCQGLGPTKGRIYSLLAVPMTAEEIAKVFSYKQTRNATLHLRVLGREGLVRRLGDGRYERTDVDLDAVAARRGVLGTSARQSARHRMERVRWRRWSNAFERWRRSGEVVDPETGEILECQELPGKRATMRVFRYRVFSIRATRLEMTEAPRQSQRAATPSSTNANSRSKRRG
jgi:DNA-binding transcriptional ArsR family regulator